MITEINQSGLMIDLTFLVSFARFILLYTMVSSAPLISLDEQCFHSANIASGTVRCLYHFLLGFLCFLERLSESCVLLDDTQLVLEIFAFAFVVQQ